MGKYASTFKAGSALFSDALKSYDGLGGEYQHAVVDHAVEYVRGNVHTNTMENFLESGQAPTSGNIHQCGAVPPVSISGRTEFSLQRPQIDRRTTFLARVLAGCRTPLDMGPAYREGQVGEGGQTPRAREAKTLNLWTLPFSCASPPISSASWAWLLPVTLPACRSSRTPNPLARVSRSVFAGALR